MIQRNWQVFDEKAFTPEQAVAWAATFSHACVLLSNGYTHDTYGKYKMLLAAGAYQSLTIQNTADALQHLQDFIDTYHDWTFGFLTYDLKNEIESLDSKHPDLLEFPVLEFFIPRIVFLLDDKGLHAGCIAGSIEEHDLKSIVESIANTPVEENPLSGLRFIPRLKQEEYVSKLSWLKAQIQDSNIDAVNFSHEIYAEGSVLSPAGLFNRLNQSNPSPFAAFVRSGTHYALCSSPERWVCKRGSKLVSQPIKGTAPRGSNAEEDHTLAQDLRNNPKEQQAENVMIVDLVRNDLSRVAADRSVKVEELFGIYSFPKVHQMISTISCELSGETSLEGIIRACFPMGSMTGAPKIKAMQLIEETESTKRGLYSGSIGYITPEGDFDFNVVIRSLLYNADTHYLSLMAGGAITSDSDPYQEYLESLLKMQALRKVVEE